MTKKEQAEQAGVKRRRGNDRLLSDVRAGEIELEFDLDPKKTTFTGRATYQLELGRRHRQIELHATDLRISHAYLWFSSGTGDTGAALAPHRLRAQIEMRPESEKVVLRFDRLLVTGSARLELRFRGRVRRDLRGLYSGGSAAQTADDADDRFLASQLCPTDARRFFPCFDEPGWKARYAIRLTIPEEQTAISNGPVAREGHLDNGRKWIEFETTPPLSSYLVAVAVGPFEASPERIAGGTPIRVYTLPGKSQLGTFALEAAAESLTRLEAWFDTPHPYSKLDLIALPAFAFGAMENAGAVFFRDSILLLDDAVAHHDDRKRAAEVIAHEISHMWFGNWVTMCWWNDLWLNEAFATWMAYVIVDDWRPDWQIWLDFAHRRAEALDADALKSSHPIAPPIRSADEAQENFDAITYTKGACVLRMLERYLGPKVFQAGIRLYIQRHSEGNAEAKDLWAALENVSGAPVEKIVGPWTLQTGYPILTARADFEGKAGTANLRIRQDRFLLAPGAKTDATQTRWTIPWVGRSDSSRARKPKLLRALLTRRTSPIDVPSLRTATLQPNADEGGFFRTDFGRMQRARLAKQIDSLSPAEVIGHLDNAWALLRADRAELEEIIEMLGTFAHHANPEVLFTIEKILYAVDRRLAVPSGSSAREGFRAWVRETFDRDNLAERIRAEAYAPEPTGPDSARRLAIVGQVGGAGWARRLCAPLAQKHLSVSPPLAAWVAADVLQIAASEGETGLHDRLQDAVRTADSPQQRRLALFALASFTDPTLSRESLRLALQTDFAPIPDRAQLIALLLSNSASAETTWRDVQRAWPKLEKQMPPILLARLAGATAVALPSDRAPEIRAFFREHPLAAGDRALAQILETLRIAERFQARQGPAFASRFGG